MAIFDYIAFDNSRLDRNTALNQLGMNLFLEVLGLLRLFSFQVVIVMFLSCAGEKPYECPDCHERFARNSTLKCHMSACQNGAGAKKGRKKLYECQVISRIHKHSCLWAYGCLF